MISQFVVVHTTGFWTSTGKPEDDPETVVVNVDHIVSLHHEGVSLSRGDGYFITEEEHVRLCELLAGWRP